MNVYQKGLKRPELLPKWGRLILIGHLANSTALLLQSWLARSAHERVSCDVIDTSPLKNLSEAIGRLKLSNTSSTKIVIKHVPGTDEEICAALLKLLRETGREVEPVEVVVQVPAGGLPEVEAACRQIASRWFRGRESQNKRQLWAYAALIKQRFAASHYGEQSPAIDEMPAYEPVLLERLRNCLVNRTYPRRPSMLLTSQASESSLFLGGLLRLSASWLSMAHINEDCARLHEYWLSGNEPDLVFGKEDLFSSLLAQRTLNNSAWVLASIDPHLTRNAFLQHCHGSTRMRLPEVVASWTAAAPGKVEPLWVTRPLTRCAQTLPRFSCYEPRPELEQAHSLWESDDAKVVALVGRAGVGKTVLVQRLLDEIPLTTARAEPAEARNSVSKADGVFVWDFYAEPFPETFLKSFAAYLNPERKATPALAECMSDIRSAINRRNLRRIILVLDGLEAIQRERSEETVEGKAPDEPVFELLSEIGLGELPVIAFITTRLIPTTLSQRIGAGYVQIDVGKLPLTSARNLLRTSGGLLSDEELAELAEDFDLHALTLYHAGRFLGDFCKGDIQALDEEIESANRNFTQLFARYQEHLPDEDLAVLKRLAIAGQPLSAVEFRQIFVESDENPLGPVAQDEIQTRFDALHGRNLLGIHGFGKTHRYAMPPALAEYFGGASAEFETICLQARNYCERQFVTREEIDSDFTHAGNGINGAARSRRVAAGPQNNKRSRASNPVILDLIERIIKHTVRSGQIDQAWRYYELQLGDEYLEMIGESSRANRIKSFFRVQCHQEAFWTEDV